MKIAMRGVLVVLGAMAGVVGGVTVAPSPSTTEADTTSAGTYSVTIPPTTTLQCLEFATHDAPNGTKCEATMGEDFPTNACWQQYYIDRLANCGDQFKYGSKDHGRQITTTNETDLEGFFENVQHANHQYDSAAHSSIFLNASINAATSLRNFARNSTGVVIDIQSWDVSHMTNMEGAFQDSDFSQDLSGWNVSSVMNFNRTFYNNKAMATNIGLWDIHPNATVDDMITGACFLEETTAQQTMCDLRSRNETHTVGLIDQIRFLLPGQTNSNCSGQVDITHSCNQTGPGGVGFEEGGSDDKTGTYVGITFAIVLAIATIIVIVLWRRGKLDDRLPDAWRRHPVARGSLMTMGYASASASTPL